MYWINEEKFKERLKEDIKRDLENYSEDNTIKFIVDYIEFLENFLRKE